VIKESFENYLCPVLHSAVAREKKLGRGGGGQKTKHQRPGRLGGPGGIWKFKSWEKSFSGVFKKFFSFYQT